jgi:hypothetical protein
MAAMDEEWLEEGEEYSINAFDENEARMSIKSCCSLPKRFTRSMKPRSTRKEEHAATDPPKRQPQESKTKVPPASSDLTLLKQLEIRDKEQHDVLSQKNIQVEQLPPKRSVKTRRQPRGSRQLRRSRSWERRHQASRKSRALASTEPNSKTLLDRGKNLPGERTQTSYTKISSRPERKTLKTQEILKYPGLTVSKIDGEGHVRAGQNINAEMKFGSMLLEVSVKKSLLESNDKHSSLSNQDTLPTVYDEEREQEGEGDFTNHDVIFRLAKNGDEKTTFDTPSRQLAPRNIQFVYDDASFLGIDCNIQRLAERKVGALIDEVEEMETPCEAALVKLADSRVVPLAGSFKEAFYCFNCMKNAEPFFPSSLNASTRGTSISSPPLIKDFAAKKQDSRAVNRSPFGLNTSSQSQYSPVSVAYDDESFAATYDDDTLDSTMDDIYTLDDSYTEEAYEDVKSFKDAARLLKTHAASQGLTGAQVLERIYAEEKKRQRTSMIRSR